MRQYWTAPELWPGATFVCIAGGPSLTPAMVEAVQDRVENGSKVRVIAVNNAYALAPWADVLYFCDCKWWQWHHKKVGDWKGLIVRLDGGLYNFGDPRLKVMRNVETSGLCAARDGLNTGRNSGYQAINLAVHLGAKRIVLLGYDMHAPLVNGRPKSHWFGDHPGGTSPSVYSQMLPWFETLVKPLAERGIEVVNATPGSKIGCFPKKSLQDALPVVLQRVALNDIEYAKE
jgi:hypothetical protein